MRITVLSKWFEEIDFVFFFFNHYSYVDRIIIYLDKSSKDGSAEFLKKQPKAQIVWGGTDGKLDDYECCEALSKIACECTTDWLIYADADEYVFPLEMADPRETLAKADGNLIYSHMWNMFRHVDDEDLDPSKPTLLQRRHGDPRRIPECVKPNIVRSDLGIHWGVGCHYVVGTRNPIIPSSVRFDGAHWQSVDLELACKRRIKGVRERLSQKNIDNLWASHNFTITREEIADLMEQHKNDPQLF